jgi:hypothetical protein
VTWGPDCADLSDEDPYICSCEYSDSSDWYSCEEYGDCPEGKWKCADGTQCISDNLVCDGDSS